MPSRKRSKRPVRRDPVVPKAAARWESLLNDCTHDVRRLDSVVRYSSIPVTYSETTASHSFWVSLFSLLIWRDLKSAGHRGLPKLEAVLSHAVVHDVGEAVTGDIVRTMKYASKKMKRTVDEAERALSEALFSPRVRAAVLPEPAAKVKAIVKAADYLSLWQFMRREAARGNLEIIPYYNRMIRDLRAAREAADPLVHGLYDCMVREACLVGDDCFGVRMTDSRWYREI